MVPPSQTGSSRSALLHVGALDLSLGAAIGLLFVGPLAVSSLATMVPLMAVRSVVALVSVFVLLAPIRRYAEQRDLGHEISDAQLLEVDEALARIMVRVSVAMALGWIVSLALALSIAALGGRALAQAELMAAVMLIIAITLGIPHMLFGPMRASLHGVQVAISHALLERRLQRVRRRTSISAQLRSRHESGLNDVSNLICSCKSVMPSSARRRKT